MRDEINTCKWPCPRELGEPEEIELVRAVIEEAMADGPPEDVDLLPGKIIHRAQVVESDWARRAFELVRLTYQEDVT